MIRTHDWNLATAVDMPVLNEIEWAAAFTRWAIATDKRSFYIRLPVGRAVYVPFPSVWEYLLGQRAQPHQGQCFQSSIESWVIPAVLGDRLKGMALAIECAIFCTLVFSNLCN